MFYFIINRCIELIELVAFKRFPSISTKTLEKPIFYSRYLHREYTSVDPLALKSHIESRLKTF